jgi:hypothetical protein
MTDPSTYHGRMERSIGKPRRAPHHHHTTTEASR